MSSPTAEDQLQDLSQADAQELRAFLEKRKWFEAKLKVLEETPPIYPFVHPQLSHIDCAATSDSPVYRDFDITKWQLPSEAEIKAWSKEHAALEEEILAFDGGDLSRMKRKTRAATLLPLTPPSTQLVSITLALIVLVDRLMKLLRQRADLLELTALRLQWDKMRWQIMIETNKVREEIDAIARGKARWVPPGEDQAHPDKCSGLNHPVTCAIENGSPLHQLSTLPSSTSISSALSEMSTTPLTPSRPVNSLNRTKRDSVSSMTSLVQSTNSPRRTFHLPLLHSSIVNLEIRQKNLSSTLLSRSGKLLDKMIDLAIPLKSLGGVDGPKEDQEGGGAVPDDLLDLQDDLESEDAEVTLRLAWCKQLEEQWKQADAHYLASARAQDAGSALLQDLSSALSKPATSSEHQRLSQILDGARKQLPEPIGVTFPRPSHPSYPEHDAHNDHLVHMLAKSHADAESALKDAQAGLEWYRRLALASEKLIESREQVEQDFRSLQTEIKVLEHGEPDHGRPSLSGPSFDFDDDTWLNQAPSRLLSVRASRDKLQESNQRLAVHILRSRQIEQSVSLTLNITSDRSICSIVGQAADLSDLASEAVDRAQQAAKAAEDDLAILPLLRNVLNSAPALRQGLMSLNEEAATTEDSLTVDSVAALSERLRLLRRDYESSVHGPIQAIRHILHQQGRTLPSLDDQLTVLLRGPGDAISRAQLRIDRLISIMEQRNIVSGIEAEAADHTARVELVQQAINAFVQGHDHSETVEGLSRDAKIASDEIGEWLAGLAARVRFVEPLVEKTLATGDIEVETGGTPSVVDVSSSPRVAGQGAIDSNDLRGVYNLEARRRVNEAAARLQSAVSHLDRSAQSAIPSRLRIKMVQEVENIDATLSQMSRDLDVAERRLDLLSMSITSGEDMPDAAHVVDELRDVENRLNALLEAPEMDDLNNLLKSYIAEIAALPSSHQEMLRDVDDDLHKRLAVIADMRQRAESSKEAVQSRLQSANSISPQTRDILNHNEPVSDTSASSDVFGTVANIHTKEQLEHDLRDLSIEELSKRLEQLQLDQILYPSDATLQSNPTYRQIPSSPVVRRIREELGAISLAFALFRQERLSHNESEADVIALSSALRTAEESSKRLDDLVTVGQRVKAADEAFSGLLDVLDEQDATRVSELQALTVSAAKTVEGVHDSARPVQDDPRVISEIERIETAWKELDALVNDTVNPDSVSVKSIDSVSDVSSSMGSMALTSYQRPLTSASSRIASNPIGLPQRASEPRNRATSDTPSRIRFDSMRSGLPRFRKSSMGVPAPKTPVQPTLPTPRSGPSSIPRPSRLSAASTLASTTPTNKSGTITPKARVSNISSEAVGGGSASRSRRGYVADPKSKLDVAVGKIVNKLKVDVPIRPVGLDSGDEWKDQSGKYWIGAEGRARLCFCRILRSKTVMVRVGGGWVELSKFLLDHFADSLAGWDPAMVGLAGIGIGSSTPIPITSASMATPKRSTPNTTHLPYSNHKTAKHPPSIIPEPVGIPTPVRHVNLTTSSTRPELSTPQRRPLHDHPAPNSPLGSNLPVPSSGGSPLLPMHFIRKASESPPVRQKEKEQLAGRRSILGRSTSGNVRLEESPEKRVSESMVL